MFNEKSLGVIESLNEVMLVDVEVEKRMSGTREGHEAGDVALRAKTLAELVDGGDRGDGVFVAVKEDHWGEFTVDVFCGAGAAGFSFIDKLIMADSALGGVDDRTPKYERIG